MEKGIPYLGIAKNGLVVRSSLGEDTIFEASCAEECHHIVHVWKMACARLVSHAVSGNGELMISEYFNEVRVNKKVNMHSFSVAHESLFFSKGYVDGGIYSPNILQTEKTSAMHESYQEQY